jgi:hypothetical protein
LVSGQLLPNWPSSRKLKLLQAFPFHRAELSLVTAPKLTTSFITESLVGQITDAVLARDPLRRSQRPEKRRAEVLA